MVTLTRTVWAVGWGQKPDCRRLGENRKRMRRQQTQVTLLKSALTGDREKGCSRKGQWGSREGLIVLCLWDK